MITRFFKKLSWVALAVVLAVGIYGFVRVSSVLAQVALPPFINLSLSTYPLDKPVIDFVAGASPAHVGISVGYFPGKTVSVDLKAILLKAQGSGKYPGLDGIDIKNLFYKEWEADMLGAVRNGDFQLDPLGSGVISGTISPVLAGTISYVAVEGRIDLATPGNPPSYHYPIGVHFIVNTLDVCAPTIISAPKLTDAYITSTTQDRKFTPPVSPVTPFDTFAVDFTFSSACPQASIATFIPNIETINDGGASVDIVTGSLVKQTGTDNRWRWTLTGWPNGITTNVANMEVLIDSIVKKRTISAVLKRPSGSELGGRQIDNKEVKACLQLYGKAEAGKLPFVFMRSDGQSTAPAALINKTKDVRTTLMATDPFKKYQDRFLFMVDLSRFKELDFLRDLPKNSADPGNGFMDIALKKISQCPNGLVNIAYGSIQEIVPGAEAIAFSKSIFAPLAFSSLKMVHEIGHAFASLKDEYVSAGHGGINLALYSKTNCTSVPMDRYAYDGKLYGDTGTLGCGSSALNKPSQASIMNRDNMTAKFNTVSCGFILTAIKGRDPKSHYPECSEIELVKSAYDRLPETVTGVINMPYHLATLATLNANSIKEAITAADLNGKSLKNALDTALSRMLELDSDTQKLVSKFITESVKNLGKERNLSSQETDLLFSGMKSGDATFIVESFTLDTGTIRNGFKSKLLYRIKKDTPSPLSKNLSKNGNLTAESIRFPYEDLMPLPTVSGVAPVTGSSANTFRASGTGFDVDGDNMIKLIPFPTSSSNRFYAVDSVSGNQSSLTFIVPTTVPDGTYTMSISRFSSQWTNTTYTVTVNGNGLGDPGTAVADWWSEPWPTTVPVVTLTATPSSFSAFNPSTVISWASTEAAYCYASGSWTGARAPAGTLSIVTPTVASTYTMVCANLIGDSQPVSVNVLPPPTITLISPNGGEVVTLGGIVRWTTSDTSSIPSVVIELASAGTAIWTNLITGGTGTTPNDGSHNITIPLSTPAGSYVIRVSGTHTDSGLVVSDSSDAPFTISPAVVAPIVNPYTASASLTAGRSDNTITGSGFSPTGNRVEISTPYYTRPPSSIPRLLSALNKNNNLASVGALATFTSRTTETERIWEITDIPSADGTSITFAIPAGIPHGTSTLKAAALNGPWSAPISVRISSIVSAGQYPLVCSLIGDLNRDGVISQADYTMQGQVVAGNIPMTEYLSYASDIKGDNRVSITDYVALGNYTADLPLPSGVSTWLSACRPLSRPLVCGPKGDVNADGSITTADVNLLASLILTPTTPSASQLIAGDVNGDGRLSVAGDIYPLRSYLNNTTSTFPGCVGVTLATPISLSGASSFEQLTSQLLSSVSQNIVAQEVGGQSVVPAEIASLTTLRKEKGTELMKNNPLLFSSLAIRNAKRADFSVAIQNDIEQEVELTGRLNILHIDDFTDPKNSKFEYRLDVTDAEYGGSGGGVLSWLKSVFSSPDISGEHLFYPIDPPEVSRSGAIVKVKGFKLGNAVSADSVSDAVEILDAPPALDSVGDQKTLVLLVKPTAGTPEPFTVAEAREKVFNGQFQAFMREQSYNKVSFSGEVYGWFVLPGLSVFPPGQEEWDIIINQAGIDISLYSRVVYLTATLGGGYSTVGRSFTTINSRRYLLSHSSVGLQPYGADSQPFPWTDFDFITSHEVGHALGVVHSNGLDCGEQTLNDACSHIEYGNYFSAMGNFNGHSLHFNGLYKELLGWIAPENSLSIRTTGTYTINPLETGSGINVAKIFAQGASAPSFSLELRKGVGFDSKLNQSPYLSNQSGLMVNSITSGYSTSLLDMSPTTDLWYQDTTQATLNMSGGIFNDPRSGISIGPVLSVSTTSIVFRVDVGAPVCVRQTPLILSALAPASVSAGMSGNIHVVYENRDYLSCAVSTFSINSVFPIGWTYTLDPSLDQVLPPEKSDVRQVNFQVPLGVLPGVYTVTSEVLNSVSGLRQSFTTDIVVAEPPIITSILPDSGFVGARVSIQGTGFDPSVNRIDFFNSLEYEWKINLPSTALTGSTAREIVFTVPSVVRNCSGGPGVCSQMPTPAGDFKIRVTGANDLQSNEMDFMVSPSPTVTVLNPNGGETLLAGPTGRTVRWTTSATSTIATVEISLVNSGTTPPLKEPITTGSTPNDGVEVLLIPESIPLGTYRIHISGTVLGGDTIYNVNERPFTIASSKPLVCPFVGDLNRDGVISQADYTMQGQVVAGNIPMTEYLSYASDVHSVVGSGGRNISLSDWVALGNYVADMPLPSGGYSWLSTCRPLSRPLVCGSKGDVNADSSITTADVDLLANLILTPTTPSASQLTAGDVNGDGRLSVAGDIYPLRSYLNNTTSTFAGCVIPPSLLEIIVDNIIGGVTEVINQIIVFVSPLPTVVPPVVDPAVAVPASVDIVVSETVPTQINPIHHSSLTTGLDGTPLTQPVFVAVDGGYAYVARYGGVLEVVDVRDPAHPQSVGSISHGTDGAILDHPTAIFVMGRYVYVTSEDGALEIVDVSDPTQPRHAGKITHGTGGAVLQYPNSVFVSGNYAYVTSLTGNALEIVSIANPANPVHRGTIVDGQGGALLNHPSDVFVSADYAYITVGGDDNALEVVDISNPTHPIHKGSLRDGESNATLLAPTAVHVKGTDAYIAVAGSNALEIVDVSNPALPVHKGKVVHGDTDAVLNYPSDIVVRGNYAYMTIVGTSNALEIVDISNPTHPIHRGEITHGTTLALLEGAHSLAVSGDYVYIASRLSNALEIVYFPNPVWIAPVSGGSRGGSTPAVSAPETIPFTLSATSNPSLVNFVREPATVLSKDVSVQITINRSGFTGPVTLSAQGIGLEPGDYQVAFGGSSIFTDTASVIDATVTIRRSVLPGIKTIRFTGLDPITLRSASVDVSIIARRVVFDDF